MPTFTALTLEKTHSYSDSDHYLGFAERVSSANGKFQLIHVDDTFTLKQALIWTFTGLLPYKSVV
jgi:hypothetical protein